jgi:His-Xaa-Ser repeat protein HxsA
MKSLATSLLVPALASLLATFPATASAKDKHHHHYDRHCGSGSRTVVIGSPHYSHSYYTPYCSGYGRYSSGWYGSPYISAGFSSGYCVPSASIGFSLFRSPSYSYRSSRHYPSRYYPSSRSSYSSYSDDLAVDVQRALRRSGYYYGDIDGDIGPESRAAIREYQRDRGLPATGRIDGSLLRSLGIS